MYTVAAESNEIVFKQVSRYRRRILCLILFRMFVWSGTILIAGMGLSRFKIPGMLIITIIAACFFAAFYLWRNYPHTEHVVRILDQRLSLREGLVTAFQFRETQGPFFSILIGQIGPRLTGARPGQVFPVKMPRVLLVWPFLLTLMIFPAGTDPLGFFNFHQNQEDAESLRMESGVPIQEDIVNREGGDIPSDSSPSARIYPMQQGVPDEEGQTDFKKGVDSFSPSLEKGGKGGFDQGFSSEPFMSQRFTKGHENPIRHPELVSGSQRVQGQGIPKQLRDDRKAVFSGETSMSLRLTMDDRNKPFIPPATGSLKGSEEKSERYEEAIHAAFVQILTRQDIPQDYKEYVKSYFDAVQEGGGIHGEQRRD